MSGVSDLILASAESLVVEDLRVRAGNTWNIGWVFRDAANNPVDFTGGTAVLTVVNAFNKDPFFEWTEGISDGKGIFLGDDGTIGFQATAEVTAAFNLDDDFHGKYKLQYTRTEGSLTIAYGGIQIFAEDVT